MSRQPMWLPAAVLAVGLVAVSCGGGTTQASRSDDEVTIEMRDNRFEPAALDVVRGETVTFRFVNKGALKHDAFIGDEDAQEDHATQMREAGEDEHGAHGAGEEGGITVDPGESGTITHRFDERGEVFIGCHQSGHYEAGMVATVTVS